MTTWEGSPSGAGVRVGIVASRFNELIGQRLLDGARNALRRAGVADDDVAVAWVPGAVELPLVARRLAQSGRVDAVVTLGAVIRGETDHYDHVCSIAASGIARASVDSGVPVTFGVLTTDTLEQALQRAGGKVGNAGADAASAAIEMATLLRELPSAS
ncbi:MAG: 6,7-dimethyl-8-ribityllumazine synthase [Deinococcus-Thermus bacterium]|jgi:6,7-dimethyl-8-ribityllumazine synthase|nr:6,7-dimethyl-8-ribityllumazine synthase [Deinococcota bacterium]